MKTAIVTGATGFIGRHLTRYLSERNVAVFAVVRDVAKAQNLRYTGVTVVQADACQYASLAGQIPQGIDAFFHLAWDGTFGESFLDYHRQLRNAANSGDALMAAKVLHCKKFLLAGTMVELEVKQALNQPASEPRMATIYGTAKCAAEMLCRTLAFQTKLDMNTVILANVFGEGDYTSMIQNVLLHNLNHGRCPKLVEGNLLTDWLYVQDAVEGLFAIAKHGIAMKTYFLGHRRLKTFRQWVTESRDAVAPEVKLEFGAYPDSALIDYDKVDLDALYLDTGFEARYDFKAAMKRTALWVEQLGWEVPT